MTGALSAWRIVGVLGLIALVVLFIRWSGRELGYAETFRLLGGLLLAAVALGLFLALALGVVP